jgi:hypothetical protein
LQLPAAVVAEIYTAAAEALAVFFKGATHLRLDRHM